MEAQRLELNEIGEISVETHRPLFFDPYTQNRITGAFIVIDPLSNETLGAGMIIDVEGKEETRGQVTEAERTTRFGHRPAVIAVDDSEAALLLERELFDRGALVAVVADADTQRSGAGEGGGADRDRDGHRRRRTRSTPAVLPRMRRSRCWNAAAC